MFRSQHYQRAKVLLEPVSERVERARRVGSLGSILTPQERDQLAVATVHALLAAAPAQVAGE